MKRINHRNARQIMWVLFGIGLFVGAVFGAVYQAALVIGTLLVFAGIGVLLLFWRCPHCGEMLPSREGRIKFCPNCGEKLD
ncbi:MAG: hypothetical protein EOM52_06185 [Clostridia bacterium]|nr:hypothetical protein [Clostridia bacterium]